MCVGRGGGGDPLSLSLSLTTALRPKFQYHKFLTKFSCLYCYYQYLKYARKLRALNWGVGAVPRPCVGFLSVGCRWGVGLWMGEPGFWGFGVVALLCFESRGTGMNELFSPGACSFRDVGSGALAIADRKTCKYFQICLIEYGLMTAQK